MNRLLVAAVAGLYLASASCGGSSRSPSPTAAAGAHASADKASAVASALVLRDLPKGWVAKADNGTDRSAEQEAATASCLGVPTAELSSHTPASSGTVAFSSPDGNRTISSTVTYLADANAAHARFLVIDGPNVPGCMGKALADVLEKALTTSRGGSVPSGMQLGTPTFHEIPFANVGDETVAYRFELPVALSGGTLRLGADLVFVRVGRASVNLAFETTSSSLTLQEEQRYAQVIADRASAHQIKAGAASS
jgi:hypothetical protein